LSGQATAEIETRFYGLDPRGSTRPISVIDDAEYLGDLIAQAQTGQSFSRFVIILGTQFGKNTLESGVSGCEEVVFVLEIRQASQTVCRLIATGSSSLETSQAYWSSTVALKRPVSVSKLSRR